MLSFRDPLPSQAFQLLQLSRHQWQTLLPWLDISGLALYLHERFSELEVLDWLPAEVEARLRMNLADNTVRMHSMLREAVEIQEQLQRQGLGHLLLKGFSLVPFSVPRAELRSQLDLDFLIASDAVDSARCILEKRGYVLHAISGRSWEFKTPYLHAGSLNDLYKNHPARSIELHVEAAPGEVGTRVSDAEWRDVCGFRMPVLPPALLFVGQAKHLYKHVSTGFFRCSHVLELYRHIVSRKDDCEFWEKVSKVLANDEHLTLPIGVTTLLLTEVMGEFAPPALTQFVNHLSAPVRLWTQKIGPRCVYATWPGTKSYLLLQSELNVENTGKQVSLQRALLPRKLPPPITHAPANETVLAGMRRSFRQWSYVLFRLRYHITTGAQYVWERICWRRLKRRYLRQQNVTTSAIHCSTSQPDNSETNKGMTIV